VGNARDDTPVIVERSARAASPILLVLAALCFLLPFIGVSCNTAAAETALGGALSQANGSPGSGNAGLATSCLQALSGHDLATYSGLNLLTGSNPSIATSLAGCGSSSAAPSTQAAGIGAQPLVVVALLLILVGIAATVLRGPPRGFVAGGAAIVGAVLLILANSAVHAPIVTRLTSAGGSSLSDLGLSGGLGVDSFFNIHPAIGFWLALTALVLAAAANAVTAAVTSRPP
jgi:hypothetical protein